MTKTFSFLLIDVAFTLLPRAEKGHSLAVFDVVDASAGASLRAVKQSLHKELAGRTVMVLA